MANYSLNEVVDPADFWQMQL